MLRAAGLVLGLALVVVSLAAWRVPPGDGKLGADVTFFSISGGALTVSPAGPFALERGLTRGDRVSGRVEVRNRTRKAARVQLRAPADRTGLDSLLQVEASTGKTILFRGRLAGLRRWTRQSFELAPGESRKVSLRARLTRAASGRFATLNVEFRVVPA